jgi:hypothetical protein
MPKITILNVAAVVAGPDALADAGSLGRPFTASGHVARTNAINAQK